MGLPRCMPVYLAYNTLMGQKRASDPLEWELQAVASCHLHAESQTWVLLKSNKYS